MTKNKALSIILIMAIVVFTGGVIAEKISSTSDTEFNVFFQKPECVTVTDDNIGIYDDDGFKVGETLWHSFDYPPEDSMKICYRKNAAEKVEGDGKICCPINYNCEGYDEDDEYGGKCVSNFATTCDDHKSEEDCGNSNSGIAHNDLNPRLEGEYGENACTDYYSSFKDSKSCSYFFDCKCEWNEEEDVCGSNSNRQVKKVNDDESEDLYPHENLPPEIDCICGLKGDCSDGSSNSDVGSCAIQYTIVGDCSAGEDFVTRSWTADFLNLADDQICSSGTLDNCAQRFEEGYYCMTDGILDSGVCTPGYCKPGSEVIPCERVVRLPFFSLQNIIIAIILLVIIYYFILKKKKK